MTDLLRLTNSEMSTWRRCHRKWYWEGYRGLRRKSLDTAGTPTAVGTRTHSALAEHYRGGDALAYLDAGITADAERFPLQERQVRSDGDLCRAMVEGYLEWLEETGADAGLRVVAAETKVEAALFKGATVMSKVDTRVDREGSGPGGTAARLALEFKTVGNLKSALPTLQIDTQMLTQHLSEYLWLKERGENAEGRAQGVLYRMLRKVKRTASAHPPFYGEEEVPHSIDELRNHWYHVVSIAKSILDATERLDAGEGHDSVCVPNPQQSCSWYCPLLNACKLAYAGADVEGYIEEHFEVADPLERYDGLEDAEAT